MNTTKGFITCLILGGVLGAGYHTVMTDLKEISHQQTYEEERRSLAFEECTSSYLRAWKRMESVKASGREATDIEESAGKYCFYIKKGK